MSAHMKKRRIKSANNYIIVKHAGHVYRFPRQVAKKYKIQNIQPDKPVSSDDVFASINKKYTKPGALLRGLRVREDLTQVELARMIKVTQSDVSQMENGTRRIGRTIAKRIEKLFNIDYRLFLE